MGETGASTRATPEVALNTGHKMPLIALGTSASPQPSTGALTPILLEAIETGYRHFDTAALYGSEESVGSAVSEALKRHLIKSRDEVFITTKLWCTDANPALVLPALKKSLERLGLEYVDLYLIHMPIRLKEGTQATDMSKSILEFDIKGTWEAMEECSKLGLAKSIGVSNFGPKKLSQILQFCTIPPAVDQVEMHVAWKQEKLRGFCKEKGIHVSAWSPLASNGSTFWGSMAVMGSPILKDIAKARGTTVAQVALRWVYDQGSTVIVKSFNKERMKENLRILEWEMQLTEDELEKISHVPPCQGLPGHEFVNESGPGYKSLEELWE